MGKGTVWRHMGAAKQAPTKGEFQELDGDTGHSWREGSLWR